MDAVPSMLEYIVRGAASAVLPMNLLVMFLGLIVGIVGGMLPGITTVTAVALFVPFKMCIRDSGNGVRREAAGLRLIEQLKKAAQGDVYKRQQ